MLLPNKLFGSLNSWWHKRTAQRELKKFHDHYLAESGAYGDNIVTLLRAAESRRARKATPEKPPLGHRAPVVTLQRDAASRTLSA